MDKLMITKLQLGLNVRMPSSTTIRKIDAFPPKIFTLVQLQLTCANLYMDIQIVVYP